jgi:hypothetical protein
MKQILFGKESEKHYRFSEISRKNIELQIEETEHFVIHKLYYFLHLKRGMTDVFSKERNENIAPIVFRRGIPIGFLIYTTENTVR